MELESLSSLPDRFNLAFSDRGWIMYEMLNVEVAREATNLAEKGNMDAAEAVLVAHYNADTVRWLLGTMQAVTAFRSRMPLARKALDDYVAGRYHACVPVVLALMDGLVSEVHEKARGRARGFFADEVDLTAWDSIAAHDSGLAALSRVLGTSRRATRVEPISMP